MQAAGKTVLGVVGRALLAGPRVALLPLAPLLRKPTPSYTFRKLSDAAKQVMAAARPLVSNVTPLASNVKVEWGDGCEDVYPNLWLRDNCQCHECFHPTAAIKNVELKELQLSLRPTTVQVNEDGDLLEIEWSDGHLSKYPARWLHQRAFNPAQQKAYMQKLRLEPKPWGRELKENIPQASFKQLLEDDGALLTFLRQLEEVGLVQVTQAPTQPGQVHTLTKRVGSIKPTHYGETFHVFAKADPSNVAYTPVALDMHTDLPGLQTTPEVFLLHCMDQSSGEGGDSLLTDALHAASLLRQRHPDHFTTLATTHVYYCDVNTDEGHEFQFRTTHPTIELDHKGNFRRIHYQQWGKDSFFEGTPEEVQRWYEAMLALRDIIYHPDNHFQLKMQPGTILVLDNWRVMHGRLCYDIPKEGESRRHLEGGYLSWDDIRSRRRVLEAKQEQQP